MLSKPIVIFFGAVIIFSVGLWYLVSTAMHDEKEFKSRQTATVWDEYNKPTNAVINTSRGQIIIGFLNGKATTTIDNFIKLSKEGFYDGTKFHRVIKDFMIQGGDPLSKGDDVTLYGTGGPDYSFEDEINDERMVRGVVAMANRGPDTNGSQFFILTAESRHDLEGSYTIFGKVLDGMDVVDTISGVKRDTNDVPIVPVVVKGVDLK